MNTSFSVDPGKGVEAPVDRTVSLETGGEFADSFRTQRLQNIFAQELSMLLSAAPQTWSNQLSETQGFAIETTFGAKGLLIEKTNCGTDAISALVRSGFTGNVYFNSIDQAEFYSPDVRVTRGMFEQKLNDPVLLVQARVPVELIADGVVLGPSPFTRRMQSDAQFGLQHISRIAIAAPDELLADSFQPTERLQSWGQRYLSFVNELASVGIVTEENSKGAAFIQKVQTLLAGS